MALTTLNVSTIMHWIQDPDMVRSFPDCLGVAAQQLKNVPKKTGCRRCQAQRQSVEIDYNAILRCLAHMPMQGRRDLKAKLGADKIRITYVKMVGKSRASAIITY